MRLLAALIAIGLLGSTGGTAVADKTTGIDRGEVQQALDKITTGGWALGVQARLSDEQGGFLRRAGVAELGTLRPVPHIGRFRIGSITKTFVSVVILQLTAEGRVHLDAPVDRYLPGLIDKRITVRQILQHTSGLFNYTDGFSQIPDDFEKIRFKTWRPQEQIEMATLKPLEFTPGTKWSYSNTNFIVAGLLIEKITGKPYSTAIERRILKPLRLKDTTFPGADVRIPDTHARGYYTVAGKPVDVTELNPTLGWAAGEMISTTADLDTFATALTKGRLLRKAQQEELTKTTATSPEYGLGIEVLTLPCGATVWGHRGNIFGYASDMLTSPTGSRRLQASFTWAPEEGHDDGYEELLNTVFCNQKMPQVGSRVHETQTQRS